MASRSTENKFLIVSSILVVIVGIKTVGSLLDQPLDEIKTTRQVAAVKESEIPSSKSISSALSKAANLNFDCGKENKNEVSVRGPFLQIHGKGCQNLGGKNAITIINKSNGYTASVFSKGPSEFTTDMIQLNEGQNQILIQYQNARGQRQERKLVVKSSHI